MAKSVNEQLAEGVRLANAARADVQEVLGILRAVPQNHHCPELRQALRHVLTIQAALRIVEDDLAHAAVNWQDQGLALKAMEVAPE